MKSNIYKFYKVSIIYLLISIYMSICTNINHSHENMEYAIGILGCILYIVYIKKSIKYMEDDDTKKYWNLVLLSGVCFGMGEVVWCILEVFLKLDSNMIVDNTNLFYITSNVALFLSSTKLYKLNKEKSLKDNKYKVNTFVIYIMYIPLSVISIIPIIKNLMYIPYNHGYMIISLILSFISLMNLSIVYVNNKKSDYLDKIMLIQLLGTLMYALADLVYIYRFLDGTYQSVRVLNLFWIFSFLIMALASINQAHYEKNEELYYEYKSKEWVSYLAILAVMLLLAVDITNNYQAIIGVLVSVIIIRQIKILNENKILVSDYKAINIDLENKVYERTEELTLKNERLNYLINKDMLTGLYNRRYLFDRIDELIELSKEENRTFGILFMDLDKFKNINDLYGHEVGDLYLKKVSKRLLKLEDKYNEIIRQGGDEFIIISTEIKSEEDMNTLVQKVISQFDEKVTVGEFGLNITFSIGGVMYPRDGEDKMTLMKKADIAMYDCKKYNQNKFVLYRAELSMTRKLKIEALLREAIEKDELELYYQPQINTDSNSIVGVEALLRWTNSEFGSVSPGEFIPIAEESGFIIDIGSWVVKTVFEKVKYWSDIYNIDIEVGLNVSPIQLMDDNFLDIIISNLYSTNIDPNLINLEITEESAINNIEENIDKLEKLRDLGFKISIDDFGSGYSSFKYIKSFVIDCLKIDMSITKGIDCNKEDYLIAEAITNMANGLGLNIIAEGVEHESQIQVLKKLNCKCVQGYYYEKPIKDIELEKKYFTKCIN